MKKIVITKGQSQYDTLRIFSDQVAYYAKKKGVEAVVLDLSKGSEAVAEVLSGHVGTKVDAVLSFNAVGINVLMNGKTLADALGAKYYAFLVDHPMYHIIRLNQPVNELRVITVDYDHARYIRNYVPQVSESYMIPLGGMASDNPKNYKDRSIEVLFTGSYINPKDILKRFDSLADSVKGVALGVINVMLSNSSLTEEQAFEQFFQNAGLSEMLDSVPSWMENLVDIDTYIRAYRRDMLIRTLVDGGVKLNVYGKGWDKFQCEHRENLIVGAPVDYYGNLELMADSKIVLNIMPEFKSGTHDRVFCAMLNKAVCLTDSSSYNEANFEDGKDIIYFDIDNMSKLPDMINDILGDDEKAMQIADNGYANAIKYHTWENRVTDILETLE